MLFLHVNRLRANRSDHLIIYQNTNLNERKKSISFDPGQDEIG